MSNTITIESRLAILEQTVSILQAKLNQQPNTENWLQTLSNSISDETTFLEALEYGRSFRQSDKLNIILNN